MRRDLRSSTQAGTSSEALEHVTAPRPPSAVSAVARLISVTGGAAAYTALNFTIWEARGRRWIAGVRCCSRSASRGCRPFAGRAGGPVRPPARHDRVGGRGRVLRGDGLRSSPGASSRWLRFGDRRGCRSSRPRAPRSRTSSSARTTSLGEQPGHGRASTPASRSGRWSGGSCSRCRRSGCSRSTRCRSSCRCCARLSVRAFQGTDRRGRASRRLGGFQVPVPGAGAATDVRGLVRVPARDGDGDGRRRSLRGVFDAGADGVRLADRLLGDRVGARVPRRDAGLRATEPIWLVLGTRSPHASGSRSRLAWFALVLILASMGTSDGSPIVAENGIMFSAGRRTRCGAAPGRRRGPAPRRADVSYVAAAFVRRWGRGGCTGSPGSPRWPRRSCCCRSCGQTPSRPARRRRPLGSRRPSRPRSLGVTCGLNGRSNLWFEEGRWRPNVVRRDRDRRRPQRARRRGVPREGGRPRRSCCEARHKTGGAAATDQPWPDAPEFKVTTLSYVMSLMPDTIVRDLALERHGYRVHPVGPVRRAVPRRPRDDRVRRRRRRTTTSSRKFSKKDADALERWDAWIGGLAAVLGPLLMTTPPQVGSKRPGDLFEQLRLAWRFRGLDVRTVGEVTRLMTMSIADLLDRFFESEEVRGRDVDQRADRHVGRAARAGHRLRDGAPLDRRRRRRDARRRGACPRAAWARWPPRSSAARGASAPRSARTRASSAS